MGTINKKQFIELMKNFGERLSDTDCGDMFKLLTGRFDRPKEQSSDLVNLQKGAISLDDPKAEKNDERRGNSRRDFGKTGRFTKDDLEGTNKSLFGSSSKGARQTPTKRGRSGDFS